MTFAFSMIKIQFTLTVKPNADASKTVILLSFRITSCNCARNDGQVHNNFYSAYTVSNFGPLDENFCDSPNCYINPYKMRNEY